MPSLKPTGARRPAATADTRRRFLSAAAAGTGVALLGSATAGVGTAAREEGTPRSARSGPLARAPGVELDGGLVVRDPYWDSGDSPWWKGQLHTHTARSFDGDPSVPPARRTALYQAAGYDFAFITDHDRVTGSPGGPLVAPASATGRPLLALPSVESTDRSGHLGAWLVGEEAGAAVVDPPIVPAARPPAYRIEAWAAAGALVCANHPYHGAAPLTAGQVEAWAAGGLPFRFVEVFNTRANRSLNGLAHNLEVWRRAVTAAGPDRPVWAVATDDSHSHGVGEAWIAVAAPALTPGALREALLAGRFYASNGPAFSLLGVQAEAGGIVAVAPDATIMRFIGHDGGVRHQVAGDLGLYRPRGDDNWVRVEATDGAGRTAWSQPFWIE